MHRFTFVAVSSLLLLACSSQRVVELDGSGHFPGRTTATVVLSKPFDLDSRKDLIVVPANDFLKGEVTNIHYFNEIITPEELQKSIVRNGLAEKVPSITDLIGISNAAKYYKPYLWLHTKTHGANRDLYTQFVLTDPLTLDDLFVVETHLDFIWTGVNDQNNWYPMFNALIDYIKSNSKTYGK
jgi:hypothetical protein